MPSIERSVSEVLQDIVRNIQDIMRSEVRLAKTEVREELAKIKTGSLVLSAGALGAAFSVLFLLIAIMFALANVVPSWAAALLVAVALAIVAGVMLTMGMNQFKQVHGTPDKTVESLRENVEWAKQQTK